LFPAEIQQADIVLPFFRIDRGNYFFILAAELLVFFSILLQLTLPFQG
jgi:hypothetical protein